MWIYVSEVTSAVLECHWSVVQMRRSSSPHEQVHKYRVEESERTILKTNIESMHCNTHIICKHWVYYRPSTFWRKWLLINYSIVFFKYRYTYRPKNLRRQWQWKRKEFDLTLLAYLGFVSSWKVSGQRRNTKTFNELTIMFGSGAKMLLKIIQY